MPGAAQQVTGLTYGTNAFGTIASAITAAAGGDIVRLGTGTYAETVTINKSLTLRGGTGSPSQVIIDPSSGDGIVITSAPANVVIEDIRITGAVNASAIATTGVTSLTLSNLRTDGNTSGGNLSGVTTLNIDTGSGDETVRVNVNGSNAATPGVLSVDGQLQPITHSGITTIDVDTAGGADTIKVGPNTNNLVDINAGSGADLLELIGGTADEVEHRFTNNSDGSVWHDGTQVVVYVGLEPITDTTVAGIRVFSFTYADGETITLSDDASAGNGSSRIDSTQGESVVFTTPNYRAVINTEAAGGGGVDVVSIQGVDSTWTADLEVNAGLDDLVQFATNATSIGYGVPDIEAGAIQLNQNLTTTGWSLLNATNGNISGTGLLTAMAANLQATGNVGASSPLLSTSVDFLEANVGGSIYVSNNKPLVIGGVSPELSGVTAVGDVDIRALGYMDVNDSCYFPSGGDVKANELCGCGFPENADFTANEGPCLPGVTSAAGSIILQARETGPVVDESDTFDDLWIAFGNTVAAMAGSVTLNAGDGVYADGMSVIAAGTFVMINVDNGANQLGADTDDDGGIVDLADIELGDAEVVAETGATILGGNDNDSFYIGDSSAFASSLSFIDGGGGDDTLDLSAFATPRQVTLTGLGSIDGYAGNQRAWDIEVPLPPGASFDNIDTVVGTPANDILYGPDRENYWDLYGTDAGQLHDIPQGAAPDAPCLCEEEVAACDGGGGGDPTLQDIDFASFENLRGGDFKDWFAIAPAFTLTGTLGGGANEPDAGDLLDYGDWSTVAVTVDLAMGLAPAIGGGLVAGTDGDLGSSIEDVIGSSLDDTLDGDADANVLSGRDGNDTLNGHEGDDSVYGDEGNDTIEVSGDEAIDDVIVGGPGAPLDETDVDTLLNVGMGTVTLRQFNASYNDFSNSIDIYDGAGAALSGGDDVSQLHLGLTQVINTLSVLGAGDDDVITVSYSNNLGGAAVTYDGGDQTTADTVVLTLTPQVLGAFTNEDIAELKAYLEAPTDATLDLSTNPDINVILQGFELAGLAIYDDGQVFLITACFANIFSEEQIFVGDDVAGDTITGTSLANLIFGLGGNDVLQGLGGTDCIFGGAGDDSISGGDFPDTISGGSGNDTINGDVGMDSINGGSGNDTMYGGADGDTIIGLGGNDLLYGGDGVNDLGDTGNYLDGGDGDDSLQGGPEQDTVLGGADNDVLLGLGGGDTLNGGPGVDTISGGTGDDNIQVLGDEAEFDSLNGGDGQDWITSIDLSANPADVVFNAFSGLTNEIEAIYANDARIIGNTAANILDFRKQDSLTPNATVTIFDAASVEGCQGNDTIYGTLGLDKILGNAGNDLIYGFNSNDELHGNSGNDVIYGAGGSDSIFGGGGDDSLYGEADGDDLHGDAGVDQLFGGDGADILEGGLGGDLLSGGAQDDTLLTQGLEGIQDSFDGGTGNDQLRNSSVNPALPMSVTTFDGKTNSIEFIYAFGAELWGDDAAAPAQALIDLRRNLAATSFVSTFNLAGIRGAAVAYTIHGSDAADVIFGLGGADQIFGYAGNDQIDGGAENDTISGGADADSISGGDGNDTLNGDGGNDSLFGGNGLDVLNGGDGDDALTGGADADQNFGGAGNDDYRLSGTDGGSDTFSDSSGATDRISNTGGAMTPMAMGNFSGPTAGIETIYGFGAQIVGTAGNDTIDLRLQNSATPTTFVTLVNVTSIDALAGVDTVHGTNGPDLIYGGDGNDVLNGYGGNDRLYGGGDNDTLNAGAGNDTAYGGAGNDTLNGDSENDSLYGEAGTDTLNGGDHDDVLDGGLDADSINGGLGNDNIQTQGAESVNDTLQGGGGTNDRLTNITVNVAIELSGFAGQTNGIEYVYANNAEIRGTSGANVLDFRMSASTFLTIYNVTAIRGLEGNDTIHGTNGIDVIYGDDGNDTIFGYGGNDTIEGGLGLDTLTGGAGTDSFRFTFSATDATELDTITDWASDYIRLTGYGTTYGSITFTGVAGSKRLNILPTAKQITLTGVASKPSSSYIQIF